MDQPSHDFSHLHFDFTFKPIHLDVPSYLFSRKLSQNFAVFSINIFSSAFANVFIYFLLFGTLQSTSDKRNLLRHMQVVHKEYLPTDFFVCDVCASANEKVVELEAHMRQQHNSNSTIMSILQQFLRRGPQIHCTYEQ